MDKVNFNELRDRAYKIACDHGFHEEVYSMEHYMMMVITELSEAVNADRQGNYASPDREDFENMLLRGVDFVEAFERRIKGTVEEELADVIIRLLDYAAVVNHDISGIFMRQDRIEYAESVFKGRSFTESVHEIVFSMSKNCILNIIRKVIGFTRSIGIDDIFFYVEQKMRYNETRPYRHGRKY